MIDADSFSKIAKRVIDSLFAGDPLRVSGGFLMGGCISVIVKVFKPLWKESSWINFSEIKDNDYIIVGIAIVFSPKIVNLFRHRSSKTDYIEQLDETISKALEVVKQAKKQGAPPWMVKQMYIKICEEVLKKTQLNEKTKEEIRKIESESK
jgi:hypothetical protein